MSPAFVYNPPNVSELGVPPNYMSKQGDTQVGIEKQISRPASSHSMSISAVTGSEKPGEKPADTKVPAVSGELSESQRSINNIFQFLSQISIMDDKITSKQVLRNDSLFVYL